MFLNSVSAIEDSVNPMPSDDGEQHPGRTPNYISSGQGGFSVT